MPSQSCVNGFMPVSQIRTRPVIPWKIANGMIR